MKTTLTKSQFTTKEKFYKEDGQDYRIRVKIRYDDQCGNGHNSFSITAQIDEKRGGIYRDYMGGCCHKEISKHFPELKDAIKFHLCSSDGPMHYIANTIYHVDEHGPKSAWVYFEDPANGIERKCVKYCDVTEAQEMCSTPSKTFNYVTKAGYRYEKDPKTAKKSDLYAARSCAIWPDATLEQLQDKDALLARLPALMEEFKKCVESFGFTY